MQWKWLFFTFSILSFSFLHAQKVIILDKEEKNNIGMYTSFYKDSSQQLTIQDILKSDHTFTPCTKKVFTSAHMSSTFWIKFQIKNTTGYKYYLIIDNPILNEIDFYRVNGKTAQLLSHTGNLLPFSHRPVLKNNFIIPLDISKGEQHTFYIRYTSTWRMEIPLSIRTSEKIIEHAIFKDLWYGLFYGMFFISLIYVFFLYLMIKDQSFIFYILFAFSAGFFRSLNHGLIFQFFFPNHPEYNIFFLYLNHSLLGVLLILFTQKFLKTKTQIPRLHKWGLFITILSAFVFLISFFHKTIWLYTGNMLFIIQCAYVITTGIVSYRQGYAPARFYLISAANYAINVIMAIVRNSGILPYSFALYNITDILFANTIIFFSLALGARYNLLEKEKNEAQENLTYELQLKIEERANANKEQKKLNESLKQSLALSKATLEATADGILVVDLNGKVRGYNQNFINMWNIPDSILQSHDDGKAVAFVQDQLTEPERFMAKINELYKKPEAESFDTLEFKNGKIVERFSRPQLSGKEIIGRVWSFRDVTEREHAEARVKQLNTNLKQKIEDLTEAQIELKKVNLELRQTNTDLDNFIYTASHDLKIPISNIEGLINLLDSTTSDKQEFKSILKMIYTSIDKFKNTIDDLIDVSRVQKMREDDIKNINIKKSIEEVSHKFQQELERHKVNLIINTEEYPTVRFSKKDFQRILENLISNAIKFRSPERNLEISFHTKAKSEYIILNVKDNGIGINEDNKQKVFGLFRKAHDIKEGRGIGLYMIKRIIENAGGRIKLESVVNKGSTFSVYFAKN